MSLIENALTAEYHEAVENVIKASQYRSKTPLHEAISALKKIHDGITTTIDPSKNMPDKAPKKLPQFQRIYIVHKSADGQWLWTGYYSTNGHIPLKKTATTGETHRNRAHAIKMAKIEAMGRPVFLEDPRSGRRDPIE